jgi:hypothetical protein
MGVIPEQLFLKCIRDFEAIGVPPLKITPLEFRNFLGTANSRRELFLYVSDLFPPL